MSGTFLSPGMYQRDPKSESFGTAAILNNTFTNSSNFETLLKFFKKIDAIKLNKAAEQYTINVIKLILFF